MLPPKDETPPAPYRSRSGGCYRSGTALLGLGLAKKLAPEMGVALTAYTDIYVPVAANTFCKGKTQ